MRLSQSIYQRQGKLQGLVVAKSVKDEMLKQQQQCSVSTKLPAKLQIRFVDAEIQDFESPGYLLIFIPSLANI